MLRLGFFPDPRQSEENKALVRRMIEERYNEHNPSAVDELCAPDFVVHLPEGDHDREHVKAFDAAGFKAFPDLYMTVLDQVAAGDKVVTRIVETGTHEAEFMGLPPTGKRLEASGIMVHRISGGKIAEAWSIADQLGAMRQLGAIPDPQQVQRNKAVVRRVVEELWNQQKLSLWTSCSLPSGWRTRRWARDVAWTA